MRPLPAAGLALVVSALLGCREPAREVRSLHLDGAPACADCAVTLRKVATVGSAEDPILVSRFGKLFRSPEGFYYATGVHERGHFVRYGPDGRFQRSLGGQGEGPGEFLEIMALSVRSAGRIHVYDSGNRRLTVLSPEGELLESRTMPPASPRMTVLSDGSVFFAQGARSGEEPAHPLHVVSPDGAVLSFGAPADATYAPGGAFLITWWRQVVIPTTDSVWVTHFHRYRLERWAPDGRLLQAIDRQAPWFEDVSPPVINSPPGEVRPAPKLAGGCELPDGRLLVLGFVAEEDWKAVAGLDLDEQVERMSEFLDMMLEVIDPVTDRVVASTRIDVPLTGCAAPGVVYRTVESDLGIVTFDVFEVTISGG